MATITGQRTTGNIGSEQREIDMSEEIQLLEPDAAPLTIISRKAMKRKCVDPKFQWEEDSSEPRFDAVNNGAGYASGATSVVVDNGAYFCEHQLVQVTRTGEVIRVQAVATNTLTVVRGVGTTAAAMVDNDELLIIGIAQPEGDTSRPARSSNPTNAFNYTQIFRHPFDMTGTLRNSDNKTSPHDWYHQAKKNTIEHEKDKEYAFLVGSRSEDTSGSAPRRTTKGVIPHITTNVVDAGGTLSETELQTFLRTVGRYGGRRRVFFGSPLVLGVINAFAVGRLESRNGESTYGLDITEYVTPHGRLDMMVHWLLGDSTKYSGYGVALDMGANFAYRHLQGGVGENRDSALKTNIQETDRDGRKDEVLSEVGLQLGQERRHGLLVGVTG